jgi:hypothetical protein
VKNLRQLRVMVATIRLPSRTAATARLRAEAAGAAPMRDDYGRARFARNM